MRPKKASSIKTQDSTVYGSGGVFYRFLGGPADPIQIKVDFSLVAAPDFYYYADAIHVRVDGDISMVVLSFGRREMGSDRFADRIDIVMPAVSLLQAFWSSSRDVETSVDNSLARLHQTPGTFEVQAGKNLAQTFFANMLFMATGDVESSLDFYHLPTRDVHFAKTKKADMHLQAVVRIILPIVLVKHFFNLLRSHAEKVQFSGAAERTQERATATR